MHDGLDSMEVLYEDNHVIVVNKPAGVAVQAAQKGEQDLLTLVKQFIKERVKKPGNVFLGLVHRIDRPVSGVILCAKTSKGASRLSAQMREGLIEKTYQAVVHGALQPKKARLEHFLSKVKHGTGYKAVISPEGNQSVLEYEVIKSNKKYSLLSIHLETGRFHQIRAQLVAIGHPIVGDTLYGSSEHLKNDEIRLRAVKVSFNDVITGKRHSVETGHLTY